MKGACQVGVLGSGVCVCERERGLPRPPPTPHHLLHQRCGLSQAYVPLRRACTDPLKALCFLFCKLLFQSLKAARSGLNPQPPSLQLWERKAEQMHAADFFFFLLTLFNKVMRLFWTFCFLAERRIGHEPPDG